MQARNRAASWKIVDKKVAKRTAVQEQIILPLRAQNYATLVQLLLDRLQQFLLFLLYVLLSYLNEVIHTFLDILNLLHSSQLDIFCQ